MSDPIVNLGVPSALSSSLQTVEDANNNDSALAISSGAVQVSGQLQTVYQANQGAQDVISGVLPVGSIVAWAGPKSPFATYLPPLGWLFCDGSSYDVNSYPYLYDVIGTGWGGDLNSSPQTFNVPDLRGYFLRGVDEGVGVDLEANNREVSYQSSQNQPPTLGNAADNVGSYEPDQVGPIGPITTNSISVQYSTAGANVTPICGYNMNNIIGGNVPADAAWVSVPITSTLPPLGAETTVRNKYVYYIIYAGIVL